MKKNIEIKKLIQIALCFFLFVFVTQALHAQPHIVPKDVDAPVDGGLSLLIAGGVGYGVKRIRGRGDRKNKKK